MSRELAMRLKIIRATTVPISLNSFCKGELRILNMKYDVVALSSPGDDLEVVRQREGVRTIAIPMKRRISLLNDIISLFNLIMTFKRERPYMVHSMTPKAGLLCMVAGWIMRVPVRVHTFTGLVFPTTRGLLRRVLMITDSITCYCATHIVPEGEGVKSDLLDFRITKKPLKVLGYGNGRGVDMEYYSVREEVRSMMEELGLYDKNRFTFLFVGRIVRDKGINELVSAFQKIYDDNKKTRLILIGMFENDLDPVSDESRNIISEHPAIEAVGPKYNEELLAFYAAADCYVLPSYREGFPNTVLEAGAMGLPCIVTNINGSREIIVDGVNGTIIPSKDVNSLYNAMWLMIYNKKKREIMAANARRMVAERFEQGFVKQCLYDFYDEILCH